MKEKKKRFQKSWFDNVMSYLKGMDVKNGRKKTNKGREWRGTVQQP